MVIIINSADAGKMSVTLVDKRKIVLNKKVSARYRHAEKLLPLLDSLLKAEKISLKKVSGIAAVAGPGPFTATRIGIATANALAFALKLPVVGISAELLDDKDLPEIIYDKLAKSKTSSVKPIYDHEPNITIVQK